MSSPLTLLNNLSLLTSLVLRAHDDLLQREEEMPQYEMIAGHYLHYLWLCIGKLIAIALHQLRAHDDVIIIAAIPQYK